MITNNSLTVYHKNLDENTRLETWTRFNYENVWVFKKNGANVNDGYVNANSIQVRIPYKKNSDLDFRNFAIGDIVVAGTLNIDIQEQNDLKEYEVYNITSMNNNDFGTQPHIHLGGE